jgi:antitoxin (DNA-binding transcriptional repressor) of toxin-antitoxin stability system
VRTDTAISRDHIYTMRQLNQQTADVLKEINDQGSLAMITKRGRFIAMIVPLVGANIESAVVGAIVDEVEHRGQLTGERTLERLRTTGQVADELGVRLPDYPDADVQP